MLRDHHTRSIFFCAARLPAAQLETGLHLSPAFVVRCERAHAERRFGDPHQVGSVSCSAMGWELSGTCSQIVPTSGGCCPGLPGQPGVGLRQWAICPMVLATPQTDGGYQVRPCRRCDVWTDSTERNDTCRPIVCDSVGIDGAAARIRAVLRPHGARHEHLCSCAAWFLTEEIPFLTEEMSYHRMQHRLSTDFARLQLLEQMFVFVTHL